ncbi:MAG TPA: hypothetical protein VNM37_14225, partial [Candidatus Dormibacteraeota bacterium]|nr:hypothetical protein [Candidatus Dormibacteraeota bacterium]
NLNARIFPAATNGMSRAELHLEALDARTPWAAITNFGLTIQLVSFPSQTNVVEADLTLSTRNAMTPWGSANNARLAAHWVHAMNDPVPLSGYGWLECENARTTWASARQLSVSTDLKRSNRGPDVDPAWAWWTNLAPYLLECQCRITQLEHSNLLAQTAAFNANWRGASLALTNLDLHLYNGRFTANAILDVPTRALNLSLASDFDPQKIEAVLPLPAQRWLNQFSWNSPPRLKGDLAVVLPAWTNRQPDWRAEVLPTLQLHGEFNAERGGVYQKKLQLSSARSHFTYSNMCWHLPDLVLTRPEGAVSAEHRANDVTRDFYWRVASTVDVRAVRPFLQREQQAAFDLFT